MAHRQRTLIESKQFERERDALGLPQVMDTILEDITTTISRAPEIGAETQQPGVSAVPIAPTPSTPALILYYAYNDDEVALLSLRRADPEARDAELRELR